MPTALHATPQVTGTQSKVVTGKGGITAHPQERPDNQPAPHPTPSWLCPYAATVAAAVVAALAVKHRLLVVHNGVWEDTCLLRQLEIHCLADATLSAVACKLQQPSVSLLTVAGCFVPAAAAGLPG
jgi:hypothetical protein